MIKTFKNLLLQNRQADFPETWYVASRTPAHHRLLKWWPWNDLDLFYGKVKFDNLGFSIGKSENNGVFSENIAAIDLKVSRSRHLIEYMKICEYWRSRLFLDLGPTWCAYKNLNRIFSETTLQIGTKLWMKAFRYKEMKICWHDTGHMTKMAFTPLNGKNQSKIFFSGTCRPNSW